MEDLRRIDGPAKVPQPVDRGTRSQPGHTQKDGFRDVLERERHPDEREPGSESREQPAGGRGEAPEEPAAVPGDPDRGRLLDERA